MSIFLFILLIPTILLALIAAAIIADRLIFLAQNRVNLADYRNYFPYKYKELIEMIKEKKQRTLYEYFIYNLALKDVDNKEQLEELVKSGFAGLTLEYNNRINYITALVKLCLLSGFFGTLVLLSISFAALGGGEGLAKAVGLAISTSLISTAAGILCSLPLIFLSDFLKNRVAREFNKMEIVTSDISACILSRNKGIDGFKFSDKNIGGKKGRYNRFNKKSSNNRQSKVTNIKDYKDQKKSRVETATKVESSSTAKD